MNKYLLMVITILLALMVISFKKSLNRKPLDTRYFQYIGFDLSDCQVINSRNWALISHPNQSGCEDTDNFPCVVTVKLSDLNNDLNIDENDFCIFLQNLENSAAGAAAEYIDDPANKIRTKINPQLVGNDPFH